MTKTTIDYAKTVAELEAVLEKLQSTETSLDDALVLHAKGKELVAVLEEYLKNADIVIKKQVTGK